MPLTAESAARKDRTTGASAELQYRHFAFIAETLKSVKPGNGAYDGADAMREQWGDTVRTFANNCRETNARFDRARFYAACDYQES